MNLKRLIFNVIFLLFLFQCDVKMEKVLLSLLLVGVVLRLTHAHVALTFPPARKYDLDFLDSARTPGPCGMPKGKDGSSGSSKAGHPDLIWFLFMYLFFCLFIDVRDNINVIWCSSLLACLFVYLSRSFGSRTSSVRCEKQDAGRVRDHERRKAGEPGHARLWSRTAKDGPRQGQVRQVHNPISIINICIVSKA